MRLPSCRSATTALLFLLTPFAALASSKRPTAGFLANDQEVVLRPAVCDQVRFPWLIIIGVIRVAGRTTTVSPGIKLRSSLCQSPIDDVLARYPTAFIGSHL